MLGFLSFIPRAVGQGIPLLYGCTGEIITEKSGNLNLGIPGVMYVGAISGVIGSFFYENSVNGGAMNGFLALLFPYRYVKSQSERYGTCNDNLRCRIRKLFRRIAH